VAPARIPGVNAGPTTAFGGKAAEAASIDGRYRFVSLEFWTIGNR